MIINAGTVCVRGDTEVSEIRGGRDSEINVGGESTLDRRDKDRRRNRRRRDIVLLLV